MVEQAFLGVCLEVTVVAGQGQRRESNPLWLCWQPAQPAEAVPAAFVPSLLSPHAAFAFPQGFPPTSAAAAAANPLSMYQQLSPAAQAQLVAYGEEMMRQKALLSMAGSTAPFMMSALPGAFSQPPSQDAPQK